MSIESGRLWTFGKGGRLSSKPRRRTVQIYNHKAEVEYAKAKRRSIGHILRCCRIRVRELKAVCTLALRTEYLACSSIRLRWQDLNLRGFFPRSPGARIPPQVPMRANLVEYEQAYR